MDESLRTEGLSLCYGARKVLTGLTLAVPPGRFTVLAGPNGSGKSTLLKALAGILRAPAGQVTLAGRPVSAIGARALARQVALLPQAPQAPEGTVVADLVRQGRFPHRGLLARWTAADSAACADAIRITRLEPLADQPVDRLSGGQRQRAWIAMILAQQARILLLDEPTTFLDLGHQIEVLDLMRDLAAQGRTVVAVLHDLAQAARYADHLVLLDGGRVIAAGPPAQVLTVKTVAQVFGVEVTLIAAPARGWPVVLPSG